MANTLQFNDFLQLLKGVKGGGGQYCSLCPAHDDHNASLSISCGKDGRILLNCHAGCEPPTVVEAMGLTMKDLFTGQEETRPQRKLVAVYNYTDAYGELLYQKLRFDPKRFSQRRPDGSGDWIYDLKGVSPVLYCLPEVLKADKVYVVEGEKDVETLRALSASITATTAPGGAGKGKWLPQYTEALTGKAVIIIPDNDEPGISFAHDVAFALYGKAKSIKLIDLTRVWPEMPKGGDVTDYFEYCKREYGAGGGSFAVETLEGLAGDDLTPEYKPLEAANTDELKAKPSKPPVALCTFSDVDYESPKWLIMPYFPRGKITIVQGDSGVGKTAFSCALAALVSTGTPLLNNEVQAPGSALMISVEDDESTLRGRIEASGGDIRKCYFLSNPAGLTFNAPIIEKSIAQISARLVVFDPLQAFLGGRIDMNRANETRPVLAGLAEMAKRTDCSVVIISHMNKGLAGVKAIYRALGSVDIVAASRSVLYIGRNPEDEDECVMFQIKSSNAKPGIAIAYTIGERGRVEWKGYSSLAVEDIEAVAKRKERGIDYDHEPLVQVFRQMMTDRPGGGFWAYSDIKEIGIKSLGFQPFNDTSDFKKMLTAELINELRQRDNLIVSFGARRNNARGILIEHFNVDNKYQACLPDG